jgi:ribose transport system substrate-binding protein
MGRSRETGTKFLPLSALIGAWSALAIALLVPSSAAAKPPFIAMSNAYYGNNWRHQMVDTFRKAAEQARKDGLISGYIVLNGDNSVSAQISQMIDLILRKPDIILLDAASLTALNGVVQKACAVGIVVVAFDSVASAPCAYKIDWDFANWQRPLVEGVARLMGGKGNLIIVRGVRGSAPDKMMYEQQMETLKHFPNIKVVSTVYGMATSAITQSAVSNVLPSLPPISGVIGDGSFGVAQAFEQFGSAGKMPVISGDGEANFVHWWIRQKRQSGYRTISSNAAPSISQAALWVAIEIANHHKVPKYMKMSASTVTNDTVEQYAGLKPGTAVAAEYSLGWVRENLLSQKN